MPSKMKSRVFPGALRTFKRNFLARAMRHKTTIDGRTALMMGEFGMLRKTRPIRLSGRVRKALEHSDDPNRVQTSPGPLVFVKENESKRSVIDLLDLTTSDQNGVRACGIARLSEIARMPGLMTPNGIEILAKNKTLASGSASCSDFVIRIYDALRDDFLFNLAGFRQSLEVDFKDGLDGYFSQIIRPKLSSFDSIKEPVCTVSRLLNDVSQEFLRCLEHAKSIHELLADYQAKFGHLALAGNLSASWLIRKWLSSHPNEPDIWASIWDWANACPSAFARYHACQVFAQNPELLPSEKIPDFWHEVSRILSQSRPESVGDVEQQSWIIRIELAKHYCRHLECLRPPGAGSETVSAFSWWLADRVAEVFGREPNAISAARGGAISEVSEECHALWELGRPWAEPSDLRYATLGLRSLWSIALATQLAPSITHTSLEDVPQDTVRVITRALIGCVLTCFPRVDATSASVYAFQMPLPDVVGAWLDNSSVQAVLCDDTTSLTMEGPSPGNIESAEETDIQNTVSPTLADELLFFSDLVQQIGRVDQFPALLKRLSGSNKADAVMIVTALRAAAFTGQLQPEVLWSEFESEEWRTNVFLELDDVPFQTLFEVACEIQYRTDADRRALFPHYFVDVLEKGVTDEARRNLLAHCTVLACIGTDTCSAIHRLRGNKSEKGFRKNLETLDSNLRYFQKRATPWVAARIRGVLAALR